MQQGLFVLPYTLNKKEHKNIITSNTKLIKIHKSIRQDLLDYLNVLGFNFFKLMPDLSSVCEEIKRNIVTIQSSSESVGTELALSAELSFMPQTEQALSLQKSKKIFQIAIRLNSYEILKNNIKTHLVKKPAYFIVC